MSLLVTDILKGALDNCRKKGLLEVKEIPPVLLERPKKDEFGDYATNFAMIIASKENIPPRRVADIIAGAIETGDIVRKVEVAGPGFINLFMNKIYWIRILRDAVSKGEMYGKTDTGKGKKVLIEFISANPTGPLHIGHARGAVFGDTMANILEAVGFDVTREFYINDAGSQVKNLNESIFLKRKEERGEAVKWDENHYRGEYIARLAAGVDNIKGESAEEIGEYALGEILNWIKRDLNDFNVRFDNWFSERGLYKTGKVDKLLDELRLKGFIEERDGAVWFRSIEFGDDKNRVVKRESGEPTYFASDIAYHYDKYERGFDSLINIWGADHHGYMPRIMAVVQALGHDKDSLRVVLVQMVTILRGGKPVTMSKRAGEYITLRDVLDEVGSDAMRFFFMMRKSDAQMEFDLELAKKQAPENPAFYVQYAHARINSIIEYAEEKSLELSGIRDADLNRLELKEEFDIIRFITLFPEIIGDAAQSLDPHRITFYLQELAGLFHSYYNRNRIVSDDIQLTKARLYLCSSIKVVLNNGLTLLGVSAPKKM
ncbi:MAG: arginine--tRNA ligase [Thermodesulfobacteriota bacterium]